MVHCKNFKSLHLKWEVFGCRVGCITTVQVRNTAGQDVKGNRQGGYSNRQVGKCVGSGQLNFPDSWLVGYHICVYKMYHLDFQHRKITTGNVEMGFSLFADKL